MEHCTHALRAPGACIDQPTAHAPRCRPFAWCREVAEEHYKDLKDKKFFPDLIGYILSGPVVGMVSVSYSFLLRRCWMVGSGAVPSACCISIALPQLVR